MCCQAFLTIRPTGRCFEICVTKEFKRGLVAWSPILFSHPVDLMSTKSRYGFGVIIFDARLLWVRGRIIPPSRQNIDMSKLKDVDDVDKIIRNALLYNSCKVGTGGYFATFDDAIDIPVETLYSTGQEICILRGVS